MRFDTKYTSSKAVVASLVDLGFDARVVSEKNNRDILSKKVEGNVQSEVKLALTGMTCSSCAANVETALRSKSGVA